MRLAIVHHGDAEPANDPAVAQDPPLSAIGRAQADWVAECFGDEIVDRAYTGPARRSRETAGRIAAARGLGFEVLPWLTSTFDEPHAIESLQPGLPSSEVNALWALVRTETTALLARDFGVEPALDGAYWTSTDPRSKGSLLLVTHGVITAVLLHQLLGLAENSWMHGRFATDCGRITRLRLVAAEHGAVWQLATFNL